MRKLKRICWKRFLTRKLFFMLGATFMIELVAHYINHPITNKAEELTISSLLDHLFFEIPFED